MRMPKDNNRLAEGIIDSFEFCIGRFRGGRLPATLRSGVNQGKSLLSFHTRQFPQPRQSFFSKYVAGCKCDLTDRCPESGRSRRLARKVLEGVRLDKHFIRVSHHALPAKITQAIDDLYRTGSAIG
jgi:hypothetical protein